MNVDGEVVTRYCRCDARLKAMESQAMRYSQGFGGWTFRDVPTRTMSRLASYYAFVERGLEFPHEDHRTEPYVYHACPFCGGDLPGVRFDDTSPFGQADGENGG